MQLVAGDTVAWTRTLSSYPPTDGWQVNYRLLGTGVDKVVTDTGASGVFSVAISPIDTADIFVETSARLVGWVSKSGEIHTFFDGIVTILPNVRGATLATDLTTHEERVLTAVQARLEGRVTADVARYGREGTFVDKLDIAALLKIQGLYKAKLWRLQNPGKLAPVHVVRFSNAGGGSEAEHLAWPGADS